MEFIFEIIYSVFLEGFVEKWTYYMKKKNPNYDNSNFKGFLIFFTTTLLTLVLAALFIGFLALIEYYFPNLLNIVEF